MAELIVLNLLICSFGGYLCICRLRVIDSKTKTPIRVRYVMWFTLFAASGISWLFDIPASLGQIVMALGVIADLGLGFNAWRRGAPNYTRVA